MTNTAEDRPRMSCSYIIQTFLMKRTYLCDFQCVIYNSIKIVFQYVQKEIGF